MTDTTDIAALRNKFGTKLPTADDAKEKFIALLNGPHASSWFLAPYAIALLDQLAALREEKSKWVDWATQASNEVDKLKGDQVPVAWTDAEELRGMEKDGCGYLFKVDPANPFADPRRQIMLYDHPQKPV